MNWDHELFLDIRTKDIVVIISILLVSIVSVRFLRFAIRRYYKRISLQDEERVTSLKFISNIMSLLVYGVAAIIIVYNIPPLKKVGLSLFASAGILAAILGFASQAAISNIIGGIFIVLFKPFRVGDFVKISDQYQGVVEDVTMRHTVIRSFENRRIIIPNSIVNSETIVNSSIIEDKVCNFIEFDIAYDADIDKARKIIQDIAEKHPLCIDNRTEEDLIKGYRKVRIRVTNLGDFSVTLRAYVWTDNYDYGFDLKFEMLEKVKKEFDRQGVEIPFPYRTIVYKSDLSKSANPTQDDKADEKNK